MALGNANSTAQARGKNKPVIVKRRKEVVLAKDYGSIVATGLTGESTDGAACASAGSMAFDKEYYVDNITNGIPDLGAKVYSRPRINDKYLLEEGIYLFQTGGKNYTLKINSSQIVISRPACR
jgi:hypothetical protein